MDLIKVGAKKKKIGYVFFPHAVGLKNISMGKKKGGGVDGKMDRHRPYHFPYKTMRKI